MLRLANVSVFHGEMQALNDVTLEVKKGELVSLIGANAAGKTTMVNTICGLHRPRQGEIYFEDKRVDTIPAHQVVDLGIAQIPEGRQLFPDMSVLENLEMGAFKKSKTFIAGRLEYVYDFFPILKERRKQIAGSMSGGQQQMVAIGRALMSEPKLLIFDEPSLGLAPIMVQQVMEKALEINKQGVTVLLIEQNVMNSLSISDRAYVLENGNIVKTGIGKDLLGDAQIREAYLGLS